MEKDQGKSMARMQFMNTEIDNLTMGETLDAIDKLIAENKNSYVVTPNVDHIIQLERGGELREAYMTTREAHVYDGLEGTECLTCGHDRTVNYFTVSFEANEAEYGMVTPVHRRR